MVHDIDSDLVGIGGRGGHDVGLGGGNDFHGIILYMSAGYKDCFYFIYSIR